MNIRLRSRSRVRNGDRRRTIRLGGRWKTMGWVTFRSEEGVRSVLGRSWHRQPIGAARRASNTRSGTARPRPRRTDLTAIVCRIDAIVEARVEPSSIDGDRETAWKAVSR